ncbi:MAG TPA: class I mannose-6-phosphate isomerase [Phototrophicaceae bacterium]|nr:class I mannose-6-phosphate isomerase [Phototrophicaceae bacterium]
MSIQDQHDHLSHTPVGVYDLYPTFPLPAGQIRAGFDAIAEIIVSVIEKGALMLAMDGYGGTLWDDLRAGVEQVLKARGVEVEWRNVATALLPEDQIAKLIEPNLGGDDPIFGKLCERDLIEFFDEAKLDVLAELSANNRPCIVYGVGAALVGKPDVLLYVDVPKDEIQYRMAAKTINNLGFHAPANYKQLYFVDWPVLNREKARLLPQLDWWIDGQKPDRLTVISGDDLRAALTLMSASPFRARPWLAPGVWGGQWMKSHFPGIPQNVPNYAWSFELIVPENGLTFESDGERLEGSFDLLMFQHFREVLGTAAERFGVDFPIRFDYLDTMQGGNLSVQVHPSDSYIHENFGEPFTQDESYYITTCEPGAQVNLGFRDGINSDEFRQAVEQSARAGQAIEIERFVGRYPAQPHDLFLIPNGTIHGSGAGNLVLEISATPYIYTFKIYDWVRKDLNGRMRPLNIDRAWKNLHFERQEDYTREKLIPRPSVLRDGDGWRELLVGDHDNLFYRVQRYEFEQPISAETEGRCHILNVVEGAAVIVETPNGQRARYNYAETFIIPAAAGSYRLIPLGGACKVVFAFVK